MATETRKQPTKWEVVESSGKVYLFADKTIDDYEATKGYFSSRPIPGRPLSKKDCLRLARIMLDYATR